MGEEWDHEYVPSFGPRQVTIVQSSSFSLQRSELFCQANLLSPREFPSPAEGYL